MSSLSRGVATKPHSYDEQPELKRAADLAELLGKPLFLLGPPGVGKTVGASWFADRFAKGRQQSDFYESYVLRSSSTWRDICFDFNHVAHLRSAMIPANSQDPPERFLGYGPVGRAFERAAMDGKVQVVFLDEVDKAPGILHDILDLLERRSFPMDDLRLASPLSRNGDQGQFLFPDRVCVTPGARVTNPHELMKLVRIVMASNVASVASDAVRRRCITVTLEMPTSRVADAVVSRLAEQYQLGDLANELKSALQIVVGALYEPKPTAGVVPKPPEVAPRSAMFDWIRAARDGRWDDEPVGSFPFALVLTDKVKELDAVANQQDVGASLSSIRRILAELRPK
jgi:MoxR-like ATPase